MNAEENAAVEVADEDRADFLRAYDRILQADNGGVIGANANQLVAQYRVKLRKLYDLYLDSNADIPVSLVQLKEVHGDAAYAYNDDIV